MKINLPQKFPQWFADPTTLYTSDITRTRNVRISELQLTGETDVKSGLFLTKDDNLPIAIFRDSEHLISYATKSRLYYTDSLTNPVFNEYSPNISTFSINPNSTGVLVYPRGYIKQDIQPGINSSGTIATANINTFAQVPDRRRNYYWTSGQRLVAVRFCFSYIQPTGTNITRLVIEDSKGKHVVATEPEHSYGRSWNYWVVDGDGGCNLNDPNGISAYVEVATNSSSNPINFYYYSGDHIDFLYEIGNSQLLVVDNEYILARFYQDASHDTFRIFYPGPTDYNVDNIRFGYYRNASVFSKYYPTILRMFNDKLLLIGNANSVHTLEPTKLCTSVPVDTWTSKLDITLGTFEINRLVFPQNYVIKWIDCSHDTVYIGATQYVVPFNEVGKSVVLMWQPTSDRQEMYDVLDGENIGKVVDNYLYILTSKGNIQVLYNGTFKQITKIFGTIENYNIQLPHVNGVAVKQRQICYLLPGNKYFPAGVYTFDIDTGKVYHSHSIYYSTTNKRDYGGDQPQVTTGALIYFNDNGEDIFYAGIDNVIKEDGSFIGGLFDSKNVKSNSFSYQGYLETARLKTQEIDQFINGLGIKYRDSGSIVISEKKEETIGSYVDGIYQGTWVSTTDPTTFSMTTIPPFMKKGDRITILSGKLRGFTTIVKNINGTTITIDPPSRYSGWSSLNVSGSFDFLLEIFGYSGTFINENTLSVSSNVASQLSVGDEIEFISGLYAGAFNYITAINGNNITLKNSMPYISNNFVIFRVDKYHYVDTISNSSGENWKIINATNQPLSSDFVQYKFILNDNIKIRDIQFNVKPNQTISDDSRY